MDGSEVIVNKHGRKNLPKLPCGCRAGTGRGHTEANLLEDGSRVCKAHGRRWMIDWREVNVGASGAVHS
jgi:hypothetical protein